MLWPYMRMTAGLGEAQAGVRPGMCNPVLSCMAGRGVCVALQLKGALLLLLSLAQHALA